MNHIISVDINFLTGKKKLVETIIHDFTLT